MFITAPVIYLPPRRRQKGYGIGNLLSFGRSPDVPFLFNLFAYRLEKEILSIC
jgi:hypothetical protein